VMASVRIRIHSVAVTKATERASPRHGSRECGSGGSTTKRLRGRGAAAQADSDVAALRGFIGGQTIFDTDF
jgi:hypothetical protein